MIAVGVPVYKARDTLPALLDSLVAQTKKMFIVYLSIDCDGEDYSDIIEEYRRRGLAINIISLPENVGPGLARQAVIDNCKMCEYVMFADSDDIFTPRAVEVLSREIQRNACDIVSSSFIREYKNDPSPIYNPLKQSTVTWFHGKIYRKQYLVENNIRFSEKIRFDEDAYFNLVAFNCTNKKFMLEEVTYIWRDNNKSLTRSGDFFEKSWLSYIISQIDGLHKIIEIKKDLIPDLLSMTIINIYKTFMRAVYYNYNIDKAKEILKTLKTELILSKIETEEFWKTINEELKASEFIDKEHLLFYSQRFPDWLKEFITEA